MYTIIFRGHNASSFSAAHRKAYIASLRRISPKGKKDGCECHSLPLPMVHVWLCPPSPDAKIFAYFTKEHYAGLLAHTTVVGGGSMALSRTLHAVVVRR